MVTARAAPHLGFAMSPRGLRKLPPRKSLRPRSSPRPSRVSIEAAPVARLPVFSSPEPSSADSVEQLANAFFSQPPAAGASEVWDDMPLPVMHPAARLAMYATLAIFGVSALALCGYVAYVRWVMPLPAELAHNPSLPAPPPVATAELPAPPPGPLPVVAEVVSAPAEGDAAWVEMLASASALDRGGQHDRALVAYEQALARHPDSSLALSRIAYIHLNARNNIGAGGFAARAVEADPSNSEGWIVLGAAREALGDSAGARVAYRSCATLSTGAYTKECRRLAR
jgi:tetratricopeptide (TPR) repeat protein